MFKIQELERSHKSQTNTLFLLSEGASGHKIRSRFKDNATDESASLFHANQELKIGQKNNIEKLKIDNMVTDDQHKIEKEILRFFNGLFNGHHDVDLQDTGSSFKPDFSNLDEYLDVLAPMPDHVRDTLTSKI